MSFVKETKKEKVNFSRIPLYVKEQILQKMNFKTYATYMMTGREAGALSLRNKEAVYSMPIYRMTIKNEKVSFIDGLQMKVIPFEKCAQMKLRPQIVAVHDSSLSRKTCDFLLKLEEIPTFECSYLEGGVPHIHEFFNTANINTVKMYLEKNVNRDFDYNLLYIEKVEIYNSRNFNARSPFGILDVEAGRSLILHGVSIAQGQITRYLVEVLSGFSKPDLIMNDCFICDEGWAEFTAFFRIDDWKSQVVLKGDGGQPIVKIEIRSNENPRNVKFHLL